MLAPAAVDAQAPPNPDALYAEREQAGRAAEAADIWATRASGGKDFEASWKLARACYWIGTQGPEAGRRASLERGVSAGEQAAGITPGRPEGYFWQAANMGALAESFGARWLGKPWKRNELIEAVRSLLGERAESKLSA